MLTSKKTSTPVLLALREGNLPHKGPVTLKSCPRCRGNFQCYNFAVTDLLKILHTHDVFRVLSFHKAACYQTVYGMAVKSVMLIHLSTRTYLLNAIQPRNLIYNQFNSGTLDFFSPSKCNFDVIKSADSVSVFFPLFVLYMYIQFVQSFFSTRTLGRTYGDKRIMTHRSTLTGAQRNSFHSKMI